MKRLINLFFVAAVFYSTAASSQTTGYRASVDKQVCIHNANPDSGSSVDKCCGESPGGTGKSSGACGGSDKKKHKACKYAGTSFCPHQKTGGSGEKGNTGGIKKGKCAKGFGQKGKKSNCCKSG